MIAQESPPAKGLSEGIQKGDIEAILQAGRSGDPSIVSQLVAYRRKAGRQIDIHEARAIQLALAKLGQQVEPQEVRCEFLYGDPSVQYEAIEKLQYLGGWFSIEAVAAALNNPSYKLYKAMGPDSALAPLGWYAVRRLPSLVPNPPAIDSGILQPGSDRDLGRQPGKIGSKRIRNH